ncbi:Sulfotransferase domain protein [Roseovarius albus]|uniref:Sulfotransferase domain protein n=1 Tax=Roseovarius albus TaxID=1247867 RepID=A0A1X6ZRQ3_9RHOB|nr:sulfotransferase [Roseovarius albus]SLN59230.1 Sulfotransferase domain protein [Roseovarius albus]
MPTVVLLLSDKRSGSTILQEELCKHSGIRHVDYSPHTYFETHHWLKASVVLNRPDALYSGSKQYGGYGSRENARTYLVDTLKGNMPDYEPPESDEDLVFEGWEALCQTFAQPVFFEKSPQILAEWCALSLIMEWVRRTDLDVKIIGLVRNPLAVQYSAHELFSTDSETRQFGWLNIQRNLLSIQSMLPSDMYKLVRYEDIIADPKQSLADLCDFIGVEYEDEIGSAVHTSSKEKWMANESYTLQLDRSVVQIAKAFGYQDAELVNPHKPTAATIAAMRPNFKTRTRNRITRFRDRVIRPVYLKLKATRATRK